LDPHIEALARAAGLDKAIATFPDDIEAAAAQALEQGRVVEVPQPPGAEPWPPMRPGIGL
jgi:thiamine pyrophosphate-dependent acetolactate synthase large subunit-like protein